MASFRRAEFQTPFEGLQRGINSTKVEHLTLDIIARYHQSALTSSEVGHVRAHTARCARCRSSLDGNQLVQALAVYDQSFDSMDGLWEDAPEDILDYGNRHLSYSWCEQYVHGTLNAAKRELVQSHCLECALCAATLADIMNAKRHLGASHRTTAPNLPLKQERALPAWRQRLERLRRPRPALQQAMEASAETAHSGRLSNRPAPRQPAGIPLRAWASLGMAGAAMAVVVVLAQQQTSRLMRSFDSPASVDVLSAQDVQLALATGELPIPDAVRRLSQPVSASHENGFPAAPSTSGVPTPDGQTKPRDIVVFQPMQIHAVRVATASPLSPGATAVRSDHPTLTWSAVPACVGYRITLTRQQEPGQQEPPPVTATVPRQVTSWQPPERLERDAAYRWTVTPLAPLHSRRDDTLFVPVSARFRTLSEKDVKLSDYAAQQYAAADPVRLGVAYARLGLLTEAGEQFERYLNANPHALHRENVEKMFHALTSSRSL